ncbi:MAG: hypothetical protein RLZZ175_813 [Bacteroidota bacterium]|jgi:hypothetical protein
MKIIVKSLELNGKKYKYWLGVSKKETTRSTFFSVYFYPTDPDSIPSKPQLIKANLGSFDEAVDKGKLYMSALMKKVADNELIKKQPNPTTPPDFI